MAISMYGMQALRMLPRLTSKQSFVPFGRCCAKFHSSSFFSGDKVYTESHEWISQEAGTDVRVGITDYAQKELGDVVFAELPSIGTEVGKGDVLVTIESVKAVAEVYSPLAGTVKAVNEILETTPGLVNSSPEDDGWLVVMETKDKDVLKGCMNKKDYENHITASDG